jgi:hypothetical protein
MYEIINESSLVYKGIIPPDRWKEPYMPEDELRREIADGVEFWGYEDDCNPHLKASPQRYIVQLEINASILILVTLNKNLVGQYEYGHMMKDVVVDHAEFQLGVEVLKAKRLLSLFSAIFFFGFISLILGCGGGGSSSPSSMTLTGISVTPTNPSMPVGAAQQFKAIGTYSDGTTNDITTQVIWNSSDSSISTINNSGIATGLAAGTSSITATLGSISGNAILMVTQSQSSFQGSLEGTWWATCPLFSRSGSWSGQLASTIDANGNIIGSYSGDLYGSISGRVDTAGNLTGSFEAPADSPLSFSWQGQLTVSGTSLSGLGQLSPDVCQGMWQGTGTVSH